MVRFSCFSTQDLLPETKGKNVEKFARLAAIQAMKDSPNSMNAKTILLSARGHTKINDDHLASSSSIERVWKSDEIKGIINSEKWHGDPPPSIKKLHSQYYFILIMNLYSQSEILVIQKGRPQPISGLVDSADNCTDLMPHTLPLIAKSCSLPNIKDFLCPSKECSTLKHFAPHFRSSDYLQILGMSHVAKRYFRNRFANSVADYCYDSYNYSALAKDWVMPDENSEKYLQGESADGQWDKLPGKHFTIKRIQEWVKRDFEGLNGPTAIKVDGKVTTGVEAVKIYIYISFLSASATTVQQITAGALPRGLHILNLLKNNISAIEGLRENLPAMFYVDSFIL
ncbi:hypothetical protein KPL70_003686 [Citrus sinensis]|nr:hypothetical protein KPL70_003686 [Citrus sinensis]